MEDWVLEHLGKAREIAHLGLCDHCLGRMFAKCGSRLTDLERGRLIRQGLREDGDDAEPEDVCPVCEDVFSMVPRFATAVAEKVNEIESSNFLVGCRIDAVQSKNEKDIVERYDLHDTFEFLKTELNREIGKACIHDVNRPVEFREPELIAVVDARFAKVSLDIAPVFIAGRYTKQSREIPQTRWPCRACRGKGCARCHGTGKMYMKSVQEIIGDVAQKMARGDGNAFHGMGREDVDARMMGDGRPFVLEIDRPKIRNIDLEELERRANESVLAQYHGLHFVPRSAVAMYKESSPDKIYRAHVVAESNVNKEDVIRATSSFENVHLVQRTPERVRHRRADLVRDRTVYWMRAENFGENSFDLVMKTQSGTYVKEFVSGDRGRTAPSFSERLGTPCHVYLLDVLEVDYREQTED